MIEDPDVAIVGAGPAGCAAALALARCGVKKLLLIEREVAAGGIPRFCDHPTFGLSEFGRPLSGPAYAERLARAVREIPASFSTTVTAIDESLALVLSTAAGMRRVRPRRVLLATGIRESSRAARLVSGDRPAWVITTGALQRLALEGHSLPFRAPVVIGTELVSFSAVLTLRKLGVQARAMIEAGSRTVARRPARTFTQNVLRVPVRCDTRLVSINAVADAPGQLESVTLEHASGARETMPCDAVIFTGAFLPESTLLVASGAAQLDRRTLGPAIDQDGRTTDPRIYAAGNLLRPVETAAWSYAEGRAAGEAIARDLAEGAVGAVGRTRTSVAIRYRGPIKYVVPARLSFPVISSRVRLQVRLAEPASGHFEIVAGGETLWRSRRRSSRPERRILLSIPVDGLKPDTDLELVLR
jgi:thioredoxin reductase